MNTSIVKYSYATFAISVVVPSNYSFSIQSYVDTRAFVYNDTFFLNDPRVNLLATNDGNQSENGQSELTVFLKPWTSYTLVIAGYSPDPSDSLSVRACGRARIALQHIGK